MARVSGIVTKIVEKHQRDKDMLIQIILDLQSSFGWLPEEALYEVSKQLGVPLTRVYQIATFYKALSLAPKGRHMVTICTGTACQVRGSSFVRDRVQEFLGISPGEISPDMKFSFETVNCLGCCAMGPVMTVDGIYYGRLTSENAVKILRKFE